MSVTKENWDLLPVKEKQQQVKGWLQELLAIKKGQSEIKNSSKKKELKTDLINVLTWELANENKRRFG